MCLLSPPSQLWGQIRSKMLDLLSQFTWKKKRENCQPISFGLQAMATLYATWICYYIYILIYIYIYIAMIPCLFWSISFTYLCWRAVQFDSAPFEHSSTICMEPGQRCTPDVLAYCREQGSHRGHLYSPQNCTQQDNYFSLLESAHGGCRWWMRLLLLWKM